MLSMLGPPSGVVFSKGHRRPSRLITDPINRAIGNTFSLIMSPMGPGEHCTLQVSLFTMTLQPSFTLNLNHKILPKTVTVGNFDGARHSLAAAASNGKILMHTPHRRSVEGGRLLQSDEADITLLNINQSVRALAAGRLNPNIQRDIILVGTSTHVLAFDVDSNSDLFYKEVADGVNCFAIGRMSGIESPLAICGGNCALQGFDWRGNDAFWTVTGDNVCSLCFCDFDGDGQMELVVGSDDFDIRVFKGDEIIAEMTETEAVTNLYPISSNRFAYSLANGTLGVYEGTTRLWRIKSKNHVMTLIMYDIEGDGDPKLVTGWSSGKVDFRSSLLGEVVMRENFPAMIAGLIAADYRMEGRSELICCSVDGEIRGYLPPNAGGVVKPIDATQEILRDLSMKKQNLLLEMRNYEENLRVADLAVQAAKAAMNEDAEYIPIDPLALEKDNIGAIPANTQLQTTLYVNPGSENEQPCVELYVTSSNESVVRLVMVFAEGIFAGESYVVHPSFKSVTNSLKVQLKCDKDLAVDLHVKALVGYRKSIQFHVFELSRTLPKFSMYALCNENAPAPNGYISFNVSERPQRIALWINENFLLQEEVVIKDGKLDARFFSLRGAGMLFIQAEGACTVHIRCDDMELCGDVLETMAEYLGIADLNTTAEFPTDINHLMELMDQVNETYMVRDKMMADSADNSGMIKALLVRAEDARLLGDMASMKRCYTNLYNLNQEMIAQYKIRCGQHEQLLQQLRMINKIVQRAGKLRVGKPRTDVINACRNAIKSGNAAALPKIIRAGVV